MKAKLQDTNFYRVGSIMVSTGVMLSIKKKILVQNLWLNT